MKVTRKQLRQIINEAANPGSKFGAASKKGYEVTRQKQIDEISKELQKTVDWFEAVVFPVIASGFNDGETTIPIDYDYLISAEPGRGNEDLRLYSSSKHGINSLEQVLELETSVEQMTIGQVYNRLEQAVIDQPELKVRMESDAGDVLTEEVEMKINRKQLRKIILKEYKKVLDLEGPPDAELGETVTWKVFAELKNLLNVEDSGVGSDLIDMLGPRAYEALNNFLETNQYFKVWYSRIETKERDPANKRIELAGGTP